MSTVDRRNSISTRLAGAVPVMAMLVLCPTAPADEDIDEHAVAKGGDLRTNCHLAPQSEANEQDPAEEI